MPGKKIEEFIDENLLEVMETPPTFLSYGGHTTRPDLVLVNPYISQKTSVKLLDDAAGSGHRAILLETATGKVKHRTTRLARWNFSKANWKKFRLATDVALKNDIDWKSPKAAVESMNRAIIKCAHACIPRGQVKSFRPFWNRKLESLKKNRNAARKKAEKTHNLSDCIELRKTQATLQKEIKQSKRQAFRNFLANMDFRKDGLKAHRFISRLENDSGAKQQEPLKHGTHHYTHPKDIANLFCKHYANTSRICKSRSSYKSLLKNPIPTCLTKSDHEECTDEFTLSELTRALHKTKSRKAAGVDQIFPEFLKNLGDEAKGILLNVINLTWNSHVPHQWKKGEIIPILKKGKPASETESYRPVALTSATCKVAERMVTNRLNHYFDSHAIVDVDQAGFRPKRSTMDHVVYFSQQVKDGYHRKLSTLAVMVDFKNAYDKIWKPMLLHKLSRTGVAGNLFSWVKSFISQRYIRVRFENSISKFRSQSQGLAQGAVLSCTLFNLMINDVLETVRGVPGVNALLYADDLIMWASSSNIRALEVTLTSALSQLEKWADLNAMTVNPTKTTFQLFTLSTKPPKVSLRYKGNGLPESNISNYLGISIDKKMTWKPHIEECAFKASKRSRLLKRLAATTWGANQDVLTTAYKSYVRPVLEYGAEATITASTATAKRLELVQNTALRVITGAPKSTPIAAMEAQLQVEPIQTRRHKMTLCFWERYKRTYSARWSEYKQATDRLKTQTTPLTVYNQLINKYNIHPGEPAKSTFNGKLFHNLPDANLSLYQHNLKKWESSPQELRIAALQTLDHYYPSDEWLHIYTDGSALPGNGAGAGFFCKLFEGYTAVGTNQSNYDGEVEAITAAATELGKTNNPSKVVFLVDSMAAILGVTNNSNTDCQRTALCRELLDSLQRNGWHIRFQWVPSHVDIAGNEKADSLAKLGANLPQPSVPTSYTSIKAQINSAISFKIKEHLKEKSHNKSWASIVDNPINRNLPRSTNVALFRLATGHDYLAAHLHKIHVFPSPECILCGVGVMNADHLLTCSALDHSLADDDEQRRVSRLYWSARHQMAQQPRVGVG